jgi:hypothetical protein
MEQVHFIEELGIQFSDTGEQPADQQLVGRADDPIVALPGRTWGTYENMLPSKEGPTSPSYFLFHFLISLGF